MPILTKLLRKEAEPAFRQLITGNDEACARLLSDINDPAKQAIGAAACFSVEVDETPPTYEWMTWPHDEVTLRAAEKLLEQRRSQEQESQAA
jgi:hypothetical protein